MWGISVYAGLGMPEIVPYIKKARRLGASKAFTSLHIPEASSQLMGEFFTILETCAQEELPLYADISGAYYHKLPFDTYPNLALRLDFGFSDEEIAELAQKHPLILNASTLNQVQMQRLDNMGVDLRKISVCHNYYPRPETGLSPKFFQSQNELCRSWGLSIDAFIAGNGWKRPPLGEGLPTIERHRMLSVLTTSQECLALGASCILFGDMASDKELEQASLLQEGIWILPVEWKDNTPSPLKTMTHKNRIDSGDGLIRSELSRGVLQKEPQPSLCTPRLKGSVTVDNVLYGRYAGELHITAQDFPADHRVNVLGHLSDDGLLVDYIQPQDSWVFVDI